MSSSSSSSGMGFAGVLQIVFICGKLFELGQIANWSWWAVMAPTWISIIIVALVFAIIAIADS